MAASRHISEGFFFFPSKRLSRERDGDVFFSSLARGGGGGEALSADVWDETAVQDTVSDIHAHKHQRAHMHAAEKWLHLTETEQQWQLDRGCYGNRGNGCLTVVAVPWEHQTCLH